jgi:hypothetical protein
MALTSLGFHNVYTNIKDAAFKVLAGSQADIKGIQAINIDLGAVTQDLEGDGTTLVVSGKSNGKAELSFKNAVMDATMWALLQGDTAPSLGATTTPNFVLTTYVKDDHVYPEFALEFILYVQATLDSSATVAAVVERHIKLGHCIITKPPSIKTSGMADAKPLECGDFTCKAWADPSTHILMTVTDLQTAAVISL